MDNSDPRMEGKVKPFEARTRDSSLFLSGLPDLGIYPKILGIFEGDGIFLGIYFFEKTLG